MQGRRILQKVQQIVPGARKRASEEKTGQAVTYTYWAASWRENGKVRNVNLGSTRRISRDEAMKKAKAMKRKALGI